MNVLKEIKEILEKNYSINEPATMQINKSLLTDAQKRRLSNLKRCINNIADDGYIGGEKDVSINHLEKEAIWLKSLPRL